METIWQQYLAAGGQPDATAFGVWLIQQSPAVVAPAPMKASRAAAQAGGQPGSYEGIEKHIRAAILVGRLERFLHQLTKPSMKSAGMSEDEFVVLVTLLYLPRATKTQLLRQCLIEIPTGSELLKRMKNAGLISETQNPDDGRSAFIQITAHGRQHLLCAFEGLMQVEDALAVLTEHEKDDLLQLLERLDLHHSRRHEIKQVRELMQTA
ncbi:MAG: MarR family winged helix-turn-helix transcriptional regulator [Chitinophagaceae bacterium]|nr:MarR family winged helix-turn-helix transcriptional regulator [Chitinophagaceae bacterium]